METVDMQYNIKNETITKLFYQADFLTFYKSIVENRHVVVITDENIYNCHEDKLQFVENLMVVDAGEACKDMDVFQNAIHTLLDFEADRNTLVIGVGGGALTDFVGFLSSIFMRGVDFGFFPTTLLGAVDASIGGKNGVNFGVFKNLLGTINQPKFIVNDPSFLQTLDISEFKNGMAEVIKYGCIIDKELFEYLENIDLEVIVNDLERLNFIITKCQAIKINIIEKDVFEKGNRKLLNFGHTIGHAIEMSNHFPHGFSVAIGMNYAAQISEKLGFLASEKRERIQNIIEKYDLPINQPKSCDELWQMIKGDKKKIGDKINLILLNDIGSAFVHPIDLDDFKPILKSIIN